MSAEIKIAFTHQVIADAAHYQGVVAITEFRNQHSHCKSTLFSERPGQQARLVVELARGCPDAFTRLLGNRTARDVI